MIYLPTTCHKPSCNDHRQENILPAAGMLFHTLHNKRVYKSCIFLYRHKQFKDRKLIVTPNSQAQTSVMSLGLHEIIADLPWKTDSFLEGIELTPKDKPMWLLRHVSTP
jgi:hypothetical protein